MKRIVQLFIALEAFLSVGMAMGIESKVIINLSEQRAYLVEQGKVTLVSPISSGRLGRPTPTGKFSIFTKDIDHRSGSFGSVIDADGRVVNANATFGSHIPRGGHFRPAPMPFYMEFSPAVGMHAAHGCVRMPRDLAARFFQRVHIGTPVTVLGSAHGLARIRKAIPIM